MPRRGVRAWGRAGCCGGGATWAPCTGCPSCLRAWIPGHRRGDWSVKVPGTRVRGGDTPRIREDQAQSGGPAPGGSLYHMGPPSSKIRIPGQIRPGPDVAGVALSIPAVSIAISVLPACYGASRDLRQVLALFVATVIPPLPPSFRRPQPRRGCTVGGTLDSGFRRNDGWAGPGQPRCLNARGDAGFRLSPE